MLVTARVVGGIPMIDGGLADDKIVAILRDDPVFGAIREIEDVPDVLIGRLVHYFSTCKLRPESGGHVGVGEPYGRGHAEAVVCAALDDYTNAFGRVVEPPEGRPGPRRYPAWRRRHCWHPSYYFQRRSDMGELSPMHWLVIVAVIVLLFGPKRIPDVMRGLGEGVRGFKEGMRDEPRPTQTSTTEIPPADAALPARRTPPVSLGSRTNSVPSDSNNVARGGIS